MPFVTEEIFEQISEDSIVTAAYPTVNSAFENEAAHKVLKAWKTWFVLFVTHVARWMLLQQTNHHPGENQR